MFKRCAFILGLCSFLVVLWLGFLANAQEPRNSERPTPTIDVGPNLPQPSQPEIKTELAPRPPAPQWPDQVPPPPLLEPVPPRLPLLPVVGDPEKLPPPRKVPPGADAGKTPLDLVEFRDLPLGEAMKILSQQSGLKIVASEEAGKKKVSLYLKDVSPLVAVAAVTQAHGLIYRRDQESGIVRIFTAKENQRDLTAFRDEQTEVFTLLYPNAVNVATAIKDLFGERVVLSYGADDRRIFDDLQERFDRFDLINSRSLGLGFFSGTTGGFGGQGGFGGFGGGGFGGGFGGSGFGGSGFGGTGFGTRNFGGSTGFSGGIRPSDILRDTRAQEQKRITPLDQRLQGLTPEEIQELEKAFTDKDQPDRTVLLELLRRRPANIYVTVIRQNNQVIVRTSDPTTLAQIHELVCRLDVPTPVVLLEVKVLSIDLRDTFTSSFDFQFTDGVLTAGGFTTGNLLPPFADLVNPPDRRFLPIAPGPLGTQPTKDLMFQVVSSNFRARLQMLEDKNRITELATPLLMTANNEVSQIFTGKQVPITVGFTAPQTVATGVGTASTVQGTPITTLQNIGTTLLITPNINADRTLTLRVLQEKSSVIPNGGKIPLPNSDGTGFTQVPVDVVARQNYTGTVVAKDGLTIAVGGLIEEEVDDARSEVPVLGKLPVAGIFFRRQLTNRARRELVVLIRPFVLSTPTESMQASQSLLKTLSIHPSAPDLSPLNTYNPQEVLRPNPPANCWQNIFRVHTVVPKEF